MAALFETVHQQDQLGFWADNTFQPKQVAEFLEFDTNDISKIAGVAKVSVRYDEKMPKQVKDHLEQIANVCNLVANFFNGDAMKTALWFKTPNPQLGGVTPRDMIRIGRYKKLMQFIVDAVERNRAPQAA